ncbi:hypothetical protein Agub_g8076, partial [Astrephomene gubernaculifera]
MASGVCSGHGGPLKPMLHVEHRKEALVEAPLAECFPRSSVDFGWSVARGSAGGAAGAAVADAAEHATGMVWTVPGHGGGHGGSRSSSGGSSTCSSQDSFWSSGLLPRHPGMPAAEAELQGGAGRASARGSLLAGAAPPADVHGLRPAPLPVGGSLTAAAPFPVAHTNLYGGLEVAGAAPCIPSRAAERSATSPSSRALCSTCPGSLRHTPSDAGDGGHASSASAPSSPRRPGFAATAGNASALQGTPPRHVPHPALLPADGRGGMRASSAGEQQAARRASSSNAGASRSGRPPLPRQLSSTVIISRDAVLCGAAPLGLGGSGLAGRRSTASGLVSSPAGRGSLPMRPPQQRSHSSPALGSSLAVLDLLDLLPAGKPAAADDDEASTTGSTASGQHRTHDSPCSSSDGWSPSKVAATATLMAIPALVATACAATTRTTRSASVALQGAASLPLLTAGGVSIAGARSPSLGSGCGGGLLASRWSGGSCSIALSATAALLTLPFVAAAVLSCRKGSPSHEPLDPSRSSVVMPAATASAPRRRHGLAGTARRLQDAVFQMAAAAATMAMSTRDAAWCRLHPAAASARRKLWTEPHPNGSDVFCTAQQAVSSSASPFARSPQRALSNGLADVLPGTMTDAVPGVERLGSPSACSLIPPRSPVTVIDYQQLQQQTSGSCSAGLGLGPAFPPAGTEVPVLLPLATSVPLAPVHAEEPAEPAFGRPLAPHTAAGGGSPWEVAAAIAAAAAGHQHAYARNQDHVGGRQPASSAATAGASAGGSQDRGEGAACLVAASPRCRTPGRSGSSEGLADVARLLAPPCADMHLLGMRGPSDMVLPAGGNAGLASISYRSPTKAASRLVNQRGASAPVLGGVAGGSGGPAERAASAPVGPANQLSNAAADSPERSAASSMAEVRRMALETAPDVLHATVDSCDAAAPATGREADGLQGQQPQGSLPEGPAAPCGAWRGGDEGGDGVAGSDSTEPRASVGPAAGTAAAMSACGGTPAPAETGAVCSAPTSAAAYLELISTGAPLSATGDTAEAKTATEAAVVQDQEVGSSHPGADDVTMSATELGLSSEQPDVASGVVAEAVGAARHMLPALHAGDLAGASEAPAVAVTQTEAAAGAGSATAVAAPRVEDPLVIAGSNGDRSKNAGCSEPAASAVHQAAAMDVEDEESAAALAAAGNSGFQEATAPAVTAAAAKIPAAVAAAVGSAIHKNAEPAGDAEVVSAGDASSSCGTEYAAVEGTAADGAGRVASTLSPASSPVDLAMVVAQTAVKPPAEEAEAAAAVGLIAAPTEEAAAAAAAAACDVVGAAEPPGAMLDAEVAAAEPLGTHAVATATLSSARVAGEAVADASGSGESAGVAATAVVGVAAAVETHAAACRGPHLGAAKDTVVGGSTASASEVSIAIESLAAATAETAADDFIGGIAPLSVGPGAAEQSILAESAAVTAEGASVVDDQEVPTAPASGLQAVEEDVMAEWAPVLDELAEVGTVKPAAGVCEANGARGVTSVAACADDDDQLARTAPRACDAEAAAVLRASSCCVIPQPAIHVVEQDATAGPLPVSAGVADHAARDPSGGRVAEHVVLTPAVHAAERRPGEAVVVAEPVNVNAATAVAVVEVDGVVEAAAVESASEAAEEADAAHPGDAGAAEWVAPAVPRVAAAAAATTAVRAPCSSGGVEAEFVVAGPAGAAAAAEAAAEPGVAGAAEDATTAAPAFVAKEAVTAAAASFTRGEAPKPSADSEAAPGEAAAGGVEITGIMPAEAGAAMPVGAPSAAAAWEEPEGSDAAEQEVAAVPPAVCSSGVVEAMAAGPTVLDAVEADGVVSPPAMLSPLAENAAGKLAATCMGEVGTVGPIQPFQDAVKREAGLAVRAIERATAAEDPVDVDAVAVVAAPPADAVNVAGAHVESEVAEDAAGAGDVAIPAALQESEVDVVADGCGTHGADVAVVAESGEAEVPAAAAAGDMEGVVAWPACDTAVAGQRHAPDVAAALVADSTGNVVAADPVAEAPLPAAAAAASEPKFDAGAPAAPSTDSVHGEAGSIAVHMGEGDEAAALELACGAAATASDASELSTCAAYEAAAVVEAVVEAPRHTGITPEAAAADDRAGNMEGAVEAIAAELAAVPFAAAIAEPGVSAVEDTTRAGSIFSGTRDLAPGSALADVAEPEVVIPKLAAAGGEVQPESQEPSEDSDPQPAQEDAARNATVAAVEPLSPAALEACGPGAGVAVTAAAGVRASDAPGIAEGAAAVATCTSQADNGQGTSAGSASQGTREAAAAAAEPVTGAAEVAAAVAVPLACMGTENFAPVSAEVDASPAASPLAVAAGRAEASTAYSGSSPAAVAAAVGATEEEVLEAVRPALAGPTAAASPSEGEVAAQPSSTASSSTCAASSEPAADVPLCVPAADVVDEAVVEKDDAAMPAFEAAAVRAPDVQAAAGAIPAAVEEAAHAADARQAAAPASDLAGDMPTEPALDAVEDVEAVVVREPAEATRAANGAGATQLAVGVPEGTAPAPAAAVPDGGAATQQSPAPPPVANLVEGAVAASTPVAAEAVAAEPIAASASSAAEEAGVGLNAYLGAAVAAAAEEEVAALEGLAVDVSTGMNTSEGVSSACVEPPSAAAGGVSEEEEAHAALPALDAPVAAPSEEARMAQAAPRLDTLVATGEVEEVAGGAAAVVDVDAANARPAVCLGAAAAAEQATLPPTAISGASSQESTAAAAAAAAAAASGAAYAALQGGAAVASAVLAHVDDVRSKPAMDAKVFEAVACAAEHALSDLAAAVVEGDPGDVAQRMAAGDATGPVVELQAAASGTTGHASDAGHVPSASPAGEHVRLSYPMDAPETPPPYASPYGNPYGSPQSPSPQSRSRIPKPPHGLPDNPSTADTRRCSKLPQLATAFPRAASAALLCEGVLSHSPASGGAAGTSFTSLDGRTAVAASAERAALSETMRSGFACAGIRTTPSSPSLSQVRQAAIASSSSTGGAPPSRAFSQPAAMRRRHSVGPAAGAAAAPPGDVLLLAGGDAASRGNRARRNSACVSPHIQALARAFETRAATGGSSVPVSPRQLAAAAAAAADAQADAAAASRSAAAAAGGSARRVAAGSPLRFGSSPGVEVRVLEQSMLCSVGTVHDGVAVEAEVTPAGETDTDAAPASAAATPVASKPVAMLRAPSLEATEAADDSGEPSLSSPHLLPPLPPVADRCEAPAVTSPLPAATSGAGVPADATACSISAPASAVSGPATATTPSALDPAPTAACSSSSSSARPAAVAPPLLARRSSTTTSRFAPRPQQFTPEGGASEPLPQLRQAPVAAPPPHEKEEPEPHVELSAGSSPNLRAYAMYRPAAHYAPRSAAGSSMPGSAAAPKQPVIPPVERRHTVGGAAMVGSKNPGGLVARAAAALERHVSRLRERKAAAGTGIVTGTVAGDGADGWDEETAAVAAPRRSSSRSERLDALIKQHDASVQAAAAGASAASWSSLQRQSTPLPQLGRRSVGMVMDVRRADSSGGLLECTTGYEDVLQRSCAPHQLKYAAPALAEPANADPEATVPPDCNTWATMTRDVGAADSAAAPPVMPHAPNLQADDGGAAVSATPESSPREPTSHEHAAARTPAAARRGPAWREATPQRPARLHVAACEHAHMRTAAPSRDEQQEEQSEGDSEDFFCLPTDLLSPGQLVIPQAVLQLLTGTSRHEGPGQAGPVKRLDLDSVGEPGLGGRVAADQVAVAPDSVVASPVHHREGMGEEEEDGDVERSPANSPTSIKPLGRRTGDHSGAGEEVAGDAGRELVDGGGVAQEGERGGAIADGLHVHSGEGEGDGGSDFESWDE